MEESLHLVVFPWLAMGHLIPFFHFSKLLAQKGHKVTFISTPRNLSKLPSHSPLSSLITLHPLPLPRVPNLPHDAESSNDVPYHKQQLLKGAFDLLEPQLAEFLASSTVDWVVYDYASHWLPPLAARLEISRAFFCLFNAACMATIGPPSLLINGQDGRTKAEDFTVVPYWIPFKTDVSFKYHEVAKYKHDNESGTPDTERFGVAVRDSDVVLMRTSEEFEPEWFHLLKDLYGRTKPVLPVGFLPPILEEQRTRVSDWLDKQEVGSVIYVALGTEASLSEEELTELALGLEMSNLPFYCVLRDPADSTRCVEQMLPEGFLERVGARGMMHFGWAPQVRILSHDSVGGFLTHCGWNSMIEGLGFGRVLMLLPMLNEQGLNARLAKGKGLGVEVERREEDGWFTKEAVAECVRAAMVEEQGEVVRRRVREMKGVFGDRDRNSRLENEVIRFIEENNRPNKT